ncbi:MAG: hypothetical protein IAE93_00750 [Ignavibacteria bacterium]|nr:hypothetical protein [Ignavibacteria bacterium]
MEKIEILISDGENDLYIDNLEKDLSSELNEITKDREYLTTNIGKGADWVMVIAILSGIFLLGKQINDGLEGWIKLANKFNKLLNKLKKKVYFIDANGAKLISIHELVKDFKKEITSIQLIQSTELSNNPIKNAFFDDRPMERIDSKPYRYFINVFLVNNEIFYIFEVKSNGRIISMNKFSDEQYEFFSIE